jgi:hypothetical protein
LQLDNYLFYDIEVFSHNAMVVFKSIDKKLIKVFHNNFVKLAEFIEGKTLIGFNNYFYDDKILCHMLDLKSPQQIKEINDQIISGQTVAVRKPKFKSLDVFQQIDPSNPSLKKIEGNLGRMILESSVPFSINRPLEPNEFNDVLNYCMYDVDTTIDIFKYRIKSYFQPKFSMIEMLGREDAIKWNTTTISANLLLKKPLPKWSNIRVNEDLMQIVPYDVRELWYEKGNAYIGTTTKGSVTIQEFDCEIQFAFGGLHGAHKTIKRAENVKLLDVTSMYPSIILLLNVLGSASDTYRNILNKRIEIKHIDKILSDALKLILNSVYGNLNNKYSTLFNPKAALSVCVYGQIALYDLCKKIAPFCTILNINTDGIAFIPHDEAYIFAYKEWEHEFQLQLEEKNFDLLVQKDVNNYIAVKGEKIICKGGDVNRYEEPAIFKNNNARILDIALVDHLLYNKDILNTLRENLDNLDLFQYILKAGHTYQGTATEKGEILDTKVNRVFASKKKGFCLFKIRHDQGLVRFADAPIDMYLWNQDCSELENAKDIIDLTHYYQIILKRLERWI